MGVLETLRRWVDGDDGEDALSRAAAEQAKPRRQAEQFIALIARAIGEVMHAEAVPLPPDSIVIPPEYIVFVSDEDDREWQGVKRKALEQGLYHVLAEHARELAGKTKLGTTSFSVELRVDGTLPKNEIRVQHSWEETSSANKTSITPRAGIKPQPKQDEPQNTTPHQPTQDVQFQQQIKETASGMMTESNKASRNTTPILLNDPNQLAPTVIGNEGQQTSGQSETNEVATQVAPRRNNIGEGGEEATRVAARELYKLEIWRDNQRQMVMPIFKGEVTIGRKSSKIVSDIPLDGDPEVSRPHTILRCDTAGKFWVIHKGKNPTIVSGREIPLDQPCPIAPGEPIVICSFLLRIQP